ncbi:hypothetical protein [Bacillus sp. FJAT-45350]|nr:hypothetical protein [Bacillus sp. FJAT-45350]
MKEHKLHGTIYDVEGEMMVHEQLMDSYRVGVISDNRNNESNEVEEN